MAAQHRDFTRGTRGKTWTWVLDLETFLLKMWQRKHCFTCVHIYSVPQIPDVGDQPSEKLPFNSATMEDHESDSWMLEIDLSHQNVINSVSVSPRKEKTFCHRVLKLRWCLSLSKYFYSLTSGWRWETHSWRWIHCTHCQVCSPTIHMRNIEDGGANSKPKHNSY